MHPLTRREFISRVGLAGGAIAAFPIRSFGETGDAEVTLSLFHTADLHGNILPSRSNRGEEDVGGFARVATVLRRWRAESPHSLTLDLGDLYQGTPVGHESRGRLMIECLNSLQFDGWVPGNHEFDWGSEVFAEAVGAAALPTLCANLRQAGGLGVPLLPFLFRELAGVRVAIIGLITPGLPFWLPKELLGDFEPLDPVDALRATLLEVRARQAEVVIVAGHMGHRERGDDFANRVSEICRTFPGIACFIGAHTHRPVPVQVVDKVLYTQADHFGIHVGRVDVRFDRDSRRILHVATRLEKTDATVAEDPAVLTLAAGRIEAVEQRLANQVGRLAAPLDPPAEVGRPSLTERLFGRAIRDALAAQGVPVVAVLHGGFLREEFPAGPVTLGDLWKIAPYDNYLVTAELTPAELAGVLQEILEESQGPSVRNYIGLRPILSVSGGRPRVDALRDAAGRPLEAGLRIPVAVNSYDAQSAGRRLLTLRAVLEQPAARRRLHRVAVREAVATLLSARAVTAPEDLDFA